MTRDVPPSPSGNAGYVAFVEEAWSRYLRFTTLLCGDENRAEEPLQDCLVRLYLRWRQVSRSGDPHAYLRRMLVNGKVSWWRRSRRGTLVADIPERLASARQDDMPYDLGHALRALSQQQRAVVALRYYADMTERQVAVELGCSVGSVKTQHSRAMAKLRTVLSGLHESELEVKP